MEGRCAWALISMSDSDRDLHVSGALLEQTCDHVRLETETIGIGMPTKDIVAQVHGTAVVVIDGITAQQVHQEGVKLGYRDAAKTFSSKVLMEGNNDISLSYHLEYSHYRFFWLGIVPADVPVILTSSKKGAVYIGLR